MDGEAPAFKEKPVATPMTTEYQKKKWMVAIATFLVVVLVLLLVGYWHWSVLQDKLAEQDKRISRLEAIIAGLDNAGNSREEDDWKLPDGSQDEPLEKAPRIQKRSRRAKGRHHNTCCRNIEAEITELRTLLQRNYHPSAHVVPAGGMRTESPGPESSLYRWTSSSSSKAHNNFSNGRSTEDSRPFLINREGRHYVYCQVTFHGRDPPYDTGCSFNVHLIPEGSDDETDANIILSGHRTQLKLGRPVRGNGTHPAWDSVYVGGVFSLYTGDRLSVKVENYSNLCKIAYHREKTFFGIFLVGQD